MKHETRLAASPSGHRRGPGSGAAASEDTAHHLPGLFPSNRLPLAVHLLALATHATWRRHLLPRCLANAVVPRGGEKKKRKKTATNPYPPPAATTAVRVLSSCHGCTGISSLSHDLRFYHQNQWGLSANESETGLNKSCFNMLGCLSVFLAGPSEVELLKKPTVTFLTPSLAIRFPCPREYGNGESSSSCR